MILFLDFDGVLHPVSGSPPFHPDCMAVLSSSLSEYPDIRIVVTSSWREEKPLSELKSLLGNNLGSRVIGVTPVIDEPFMHHVRYHEVQAYLSDTSQPDIPWFALDDELGSYPESAPVILTDRRVGLSAEDGYRITAMVNALNNQ